MFSNRRKAVRCSQFAITEGRVKNAKLKGGKGRTFPAQKISLGHHAWTGGSATWVGNVAEPELTVATAVDIVTETGVEDVVPC